MRKGQLEASLLVLVTLCLVAFGLVMVYSATSAPAALGNSDPGFYLKRQSVYALIGLALMMGAARLDYHALRYFSPILLGTAFVLCVAVLVVGESVNGARRWLTAGPAVFQPSELAKLAVAVWAAAYLSRRRAPRTVGELARPIGLVAGLFCLLLLAEPDLGTTITLVVMLGGLLLVVGTPLRLLALAGGVCIALGFAAIWVEPYRRDRFLSFLDPWQDAQGSGFQVVQAMLGMGSGGLFGKGLGESVLKLFYLPEAHTDMIFAIIGEELGLVGVTAVLAAYSVFAYAGFRVALRCKDAFGKCLAAALTTLVCGQAVVNLAAVLGLAPLTGIPLPFVSAGGSSLVVALAAVGILLNIASDDSAERRARLPDRSRRDGRSRAAGARRRGGASRQRRPRDIRRVAGATRGAARP
ncbi:MAG: putative lipid II flippase FtsW [Gaiellaceae bacterium]